jgi:hypothetical protein
MLFHAAFLRSESEKINTTRLVFHDTSRLVYGSIWLTQDSLVSAGRTFLKSAAVSKPAGWKVEVLREIWG